MATWFYSQSGQQLGPVETADLQAKLNSGEISPQDMVWREGMSQWQAAHTIPELASAAGPAPGQAYTQYPTQGAPPHGGPALGYATPVVAYGQPQGKSPHASKAKTAFVCSLVGLLCIGVILGTLAIIFGIQAIKGMKQSGDQRGHGLAVAAIVIGSIDLIGWAAWLLSTVVGN